MLGDVEETVYVVDEEAEDEDIKTVSKKSEMLFVRGRSRCPAPGFRALADRCCRGQCRLNIATDTVMIYGRDMPHPSPA